MSWRRRRWRQKSVRLVDDGGLPLDEGELIFVDAGTVRGLELNVEVTTADRSEAFEAGVVNVHFADSGVVVMGPHSFLGNSDESTDQVRTKFRCEVSEKL